MLNFYGQSGGLGGSYIQHQQLEYEIAIRGARERFATPGSFAGARGLGREPERAGSKSGKIRSNYADGRYSARYQPFREFPRALTPSILFRMR